MRNIFKDYLDAIGAFLRVVWSERYLVISWLILIVLFIIGARVIKWIISQVKFCVRLRHFCRKNHVKYDSDFFKTMFARKFFLGYTVRLSKEAQTALIQFFPYNCSRRTVHLSSDLKYMLIYKETVQAKPMRGHGESNGYDLLNRVEHQKHKRILPNFPNEENTFLVFTSVPANFFITRNGIRETVGSGYKTRQLSIYEADDFINFLKRNI